jgi:hypothetical protein
LIVGERLLADHTVDLRELVGDEALNEKLFITRFLAGSHSASARLCDSGTYRSTSRRSRSRLHRTRNHPGSRQFDSKLSRADLSDGVDWCLPALTSLILAILWRMAIGLSVLTDVPIPSLRLWAPRSESNTSPRGSPKEPRGNKQLLKRDGQEHRADLAAPFVGKSDAHSLCTTRLLEGFLI